MSLTAVLNEKRRKIGALQDSPAITLLPFRLVESLMSVHNSPAPTRALLGDPGVRGGGGGGEELKSIQGAASRRPVSGPQPLLLEASPPLATHPPYLAQHRPPQVSAGVTKVLHRHSTNACTSNAIANHISALEQDVVVK